VAGGSAALCGFSSGAALALEAARAGSADARAVRAAVRLVDGAQAIAELLPNAVSDVVPDQTHDVAADAIAPVLAKFLVP